jgi:hypothetical protein
MRACEHLHSSFLSLVGIDPVMAGELFRLMLIVGRDRLRFGPVTGSRSLSDSCEAPFGLSLIKDPFR